jgi:hypothetical protein
MIVRLLYAADVLLPLIPRALRAGLEAPQVIAEGDGDHPDPHAPAEGRLSTLAPNRGP